MENVHGGCVFFENVVLVSNRWHFEIWQFTLISKNASKYTGQNSVSLPVFTGNPDSSEIEDIVFIIWRGLGTIPCKDF